MTRSVVALLFVLLGCEAPPDVRLECAPDPVCCRTPECVGPGGYLSGERWTPACSDGSQVTTSALDCSSGEPDCGELAPVCVHVP